MVTILEAQIPLTPSGNPLKLAPVAPVVVKVIGVRAVLIHFVWLLVPAPELKVIVLSGVTVIVPVAVIVPQPPVKVTVYGKDPDTEGVPLMVTTLETQIPFIPSGKPLTLAPFITTVTPGDGLYTRSADGMVPP